MNIPPVVRQMMVAGSIHSAALSAGGVLAYPGVLLQQLKTNDSIIHLNLDNGSWIGSVHGLAGIPSLLIPFLMQYRGRRLAFMLSCSLMIIGWIFACTAQSVSFLIIGECFHGLGGHSLLTVSLLSISEMIRPNYRPVCLASYGTFLALGITMVGILGRYLHWRTAGIIMGSPLILALVIACTWPESPSWLAYKERFEHCERAFRRLRGTDKESLKELHAIMKLQNKSLEIKLPNMHWFREFRNKLSSKDFYKPSLHTFVLVSAFYWSGGHIVIIYSNDIIINITGNMNNNIKFILDVSLFIGYIITLVLCRIFSSKKVLLFSMIGCSVFMTSTAIILYLKSFGTTGMSVLGVYSLIGFIFLFALGLGSVGINMPTELMPTKHRGVGGCFYVICSCVFHSSALKTFPYLCVYINMWGAFLIYGLYTTFTALFIWKYVPNTKNRTLQEIEDYYNVGYFKVNTDLNEKNSGLKRFLEIEDNEKTIRSCIVPTSVI